MIPDDPGWYQMISDEWSQKLQTRCLWYFRPHGSRWSKCYLATLESYVFIVGTKIRWHWVGVANVISGPGCVTCGWHIHVLFHASHIPCNGLPLTVNYGTLVSRSSILYSERFCTSRWNMILRKPEHAGSVIRSVKSLIPIFDLHIFRPAIQQ